MGTAHCIKFFIPYPYDCLPFLLYFLHQNAIKRISFHVKKASSEYTILSQQIDWINLFSPSSLLSSSRIIDTKKWKNSFNLCYYHNFLFSQNFNSINHPPYNWPSHHLHKFPYTKYIKRKRDVKQFIWIEQFSSLWGLKREIRSKRRRKISARDQNFSHEWKLALWGFYSFNAYRIKTMVTQCWLLRNNYLQ